MSEEPLIGPFAENVERLYCKVKWCKIAEYFIYGTLIIALGVWLFTTVSCPSLTTPIDGTAFCATADNDEVVDKIHDLGTIVIGVLFCILGTMFVCFGLWKVKTLS